MWDDPSAWSVLVTGGSSGLGAAVGAELNKAGASVVSLDRSDDAVLDTVVVDLVDARATEEATRVAIDRLGGLDVVVCCAGLDVPGPLDGVPAADWERVVAVNLIGTATVVRAALPALRERHGRVVTVASTLAHHAVGDGTAYCASKFGVVGFTRALTAETRGEIGVTLLTPGGMRTAFFDGRTEQYLPGPDTALAEPHEVAAAVMWCLSRPEGIEVRELAVMAPLEASWP